MRNSRVFLGITILATAFAGACSDSGSGSHGSGGAGGGSSGASGSAGSLATGGSSTLGGTTAGSSSSGGSVPGGGSSVTGGTTSAGGGSGGGTTSSGGTTVVVSTTGTAGAAGGRGGATTGTAGATATGGATGTAGSTSGTTGTGGATGGRGGASSAGGSIGGTTGAGGATGGRGGATGGTTSTGGTGRGGASGGTSSTTGGASGGTGGAAGGATGGATSTGGLPALHVEGTVVKDPNGKTIILRGSALIDIGALYANNGNSATGITTRMDKIAAAGVQGHLVRLPVYPKIDYNGGGPYCSPLPYPVGTGPAAGCTPTSPMSAADYVSKVLKPAVDYATSKNLYVIIDHHQIDNAVTGTAASATANDATTFWTDIAPQFASYNNVLYEPFNEPINGSTPWATFKPIVQGWINTIRSAAPNNIIIVPSMSYDQHPGDAASDPPTDPKSNLVYTAHVYPGNWSSGFKTQVATAVTKAPVFITEWGYILNSSDGTEGTSSATWGTDFETLVDGYGASWTAWVTDSGWSPQIFSNSALTSLTDFGTVVKNWLAAKATSDWVQ